MFIISGISKLRASHFFHFMVNLSSLPFVIAFMATAACAAAAQDPIAPFREEIAAAPAAAPAIITRTLRGAGPQAASLAGPITAAAIENLGPRPSVPRVSSIVFAAVRAVPESVLDIVRAAVAAAPKAAPEIAATAASAVPHPWKEVRYRRQASLAPGGAVAVSPARPLNAGERDFKGERDFNDAVDGANQAPQQPAGPADPGDPGTAMPLAEAIAQAAFDSQTGIGLATIQGAVDVALLGDPGLLLSKIGDPRGISGVGDAGASNFANEPLIPKPAATPPPPVKPEPPPVSR
jgi:hypothetical protein